MGGYECGSYTLEFDISGRACAHLVVFPCVTALFHIRRLWMCLLWLRALVCSECTHSASQAADIRTSVEAKVSIQFEMQIKSWSATALVAYNVSIIRLVVARSGP